MAEADLEALFPRLRGAGYRITSDRDVAYNCVAYCAPDQDRWWDPNRPDGFWPDDVERNDTIDGFIAMFRGQGFVECANDAVEPGYEKIALYGNDRRDFGHVARQLPSGAWTSKLGELEDIEHQTLDAVVCDTYGEPVVFLRRPLRPA